AWAGTRRHALIPAFGPHMRRPRTEPGLLQDGRQGHAGKLSSAEDHGLLTSQRLLANALKIFKVIGIAARALHNGAHGTGRQSSKTLVADLQRALHGAINCEPPMLGGKRFWYCKVLYDLEQMSGCHQPFTV